MKKSKFIVFMLCIMLVIMPTIISCASESKKIIVVLDPGHGGYGEGSSRFGVDEKDINLKVAKYCKQELEEYGRVEVYLTRDRDNVELSLEDRVRIAANLNADCLVSIHFNGNTDSSFNGATVYYPNPGYRSDISEEGKGLSQSILNRLVSLGIRNAGVHYRNSDDGTRYPNGAITDYYGIIYGSKKNDMVGIIVENCFLTNRNDFDKFINSEEKLKALGIANATGIAQYYGLSKTPADYSKVNEATVTANSYDLSLYKNGEILTKAVNSVSYGKFYDEQEVVDAYADDIYNAIELLIGINDTAMIGDVSNNDKLTYYDAVILFEHISDGMNFQAKDVNKCDLNADGKVDILDATMLLHQTK